jgi:hypothetical protein
VPKTETLTITPTDSSVIDPSIFAPSGIYLVPNMVTMSSGESQAFTVIAYNDEGQEMEVTDQAIFIIQMEAGGSWDSNEYTSENVGSWTVIGEYLHQVSGYESWINYATVIVK